LHRCKAGIPVVASNVMGLRESVQGIGVLVDDLTPQGFAHTLNTLASDTERLRVASERGREFARSVSWPVIVSRIEEVYASI